jgi:FkbM family methyltransferase
MMPVAAKRVHDLAAGLFAPAIFPPQSEARLVQEYLGETPGVFVDVGANDPVKDSQTWHLEQRGWSGVLIEPLPVPAARLRAERRAHVVEAACSSPQRAGGSARLKVAGVHSSLERELRVVDAVVEREIDVPVVTLDAVLQALAYERVDFVSLDVEGHELEVLRGFSLERYRPRLLLIEDHARDLSRHRALSARGYRLVRRTGLNAWYVPADSPLRPSPWGRWQLFRKYVLGLPARRVREWLRRLRARKRQA